MRKVRAEPEGRSVHHGNAFRLEKLAAEILVGRDPTPRRRLLADRIRQLHELGESTIIIGDEIAIEQEIQCGMVDQLAQGMVLKPAVKYRHTANVLGIPPRDNH
jgi:dihydroxy-acid dehydratase